MSQSSLLPSLVRWHLSKMATAELRCSHALQASSVLHSTVESILFSSSGNWEWNLGSQWSDVRNKVTAVPWETLWLLMTPPGSNLKLIHQLWERASVWRGHAGVFQIAQKSHPLPHTRGKILQVHSPCPVILQTHMLIIAGRISAFSSWRECCWHLLGRSQVATRTLQYPVLHGVWSTEVEACSLSTHPAAFKPHTPIPSLYDTVSCQILPQHSFVGWCVSQQ